MWKLLWQQLLSCHAIKVFWEENCRPGCLCLLMECRTKCAHVQHAVLGTPDINTHIAIKIYFASGNLQIRFFPPPSILKAAPSSAGVWVWQGCFLSLSAWPALNPVPRQDSMRSLFGDVFAAAPFTMAQKRTSCGALTQQQQPLLTMTKS